MLTAVIPHPKFPDFKTTIKYIPSIRQKRSMYRSMKRRQPEGIADPRNPDRLIEDAEGNPRFIMRQMFSEETFVEDVSDWFVSMKGLPPEIAEQYDELEKERAGFGVLVFIDGSLDVEGDIPDIDTNGTIKRDEKKNIITKRGPVSWSTVLADKSILRETFVPVPTGAESPSA